MKQNIKFGIVASSAYLGYVAAILIYTSYFCPNIYCEAFNVLAAIPWSFFAEDAVRGSSLLFAAAIAANAIFAFCTVAAVSKILNTKNTPL